nr:phage tail tape measure protein [uncultured Mediterranean phage uvMED]BAR18389.1 phage tail tape measure protein [uncultured Mediterranean phage uvMED]
MGLLDIWNDWKKENQGQTDGFEDYLPNNEGSGTLDTAGGVKGEGIKATMNRTDESPFVKNPPFTMDNLKKVGSNIYNAIPGSDLDKKFAKKEVDKIKQAQVNASTKTPLTDPITQGATGVKQAEDMGFMQKLSNMAGVNFDKAAANWKDKGGFEGLMANPAFSLGLALMQSSANGKTINQGILDNFVKSANISKEFKDRLAAKSDVVEVTEGQTNKIKDVLGTFGISAPKLRKLLPGNQSESYEQAVEDIAFKVQNKVNAMIKTAQKKGQKIEVGNRLYKKVIKEMINNGEIDKKGGLTIGGYNIIDSTLEARAQGGPVQEGKPYVVGEKGPEIIIPRSDGNVLSNDDSQIYAMLLASNPQLQKVSRQRAEKILRNRFPEYFEG